MPSTADESVAFEPRVVTRQYTYRNGRNDVVYLTPYPVEGPVCVRDNTGTRVWMFMYAHFVFCWAEDASRVHISHGSLAGAKMPLWTDVEISGRWSGQVLAGFARAWTAGHLARFHGRRPEE
ncbi:hypothetical protein ACFWY9_33245 [Amycolatopsis sp. NPDC059027]|uniref:hypothetical protein n=1 Tax=unclassified Amycolatopsis TaxID=2618356 RepID=UPI0036734CE3